jgi:holin-like protein
MSATLGHHPARVPIPVPEASSLVADSGMSGLRGLALLLLLQVAGEALAKAFALPIPGPVAGMVLLLAALRWAPLREPIQAVAEFLLAHLSLLFVPVGVGVITHLALISQYGLRLVAVIVGATWIGMAVTALVLRALLRGEAAGGAAR